MVDKGLRPAAKDGARGNGTTTSPHPITAFRIRSIPDLGTKKFTNEVAA